MGMHDMPCLHKPNAKLVRIMQIHSMSWYDVPDNYFFNYL